MVLCQIFAVLEDKVIYTTRGKCGVYYASRVSVFFFEKSFRVPKIVPKVRRGNNVILMLFINYSTNIKIHF